MRSEAPSADRLFEIAQAQHGLFTTKQAKQAGYSEKAQHYHASAGNWIRDHRGIYRLARYPRSEWADLMLWQLWSRNRADVPQGVYSHETALSLYELSDAMPARLHMTVPHGFDRSADIPSVLVLHRAKLSESEIGTIDGIRVTRPVRTILDVVAEGKLAPELIRQAIREGEDRGLFTIDELRAAPVSRRPSAALRRILREGR
jgi:predicted transcriptional regulator of viral defense system